MSILFFSAPIKPKAISNDYDRANDLSFESVVGNDSGSQNTYIPAIFRSNRLNTTKTSNFTTLTRKFEYVAASTTECILVPNWKWWGQQIFVPNCAVEDIVQFGTNSSYAVNAVGILCAIGSAACGIALGLTGIYLNWLKDNLVYQNNRCGKMGAYLNMTTWNIMWISGVC
ncbi:MAG: hypothetical protein OHK0017_12120 [Patescibacteria group bacterium]